LSIPSVKISKIQDDGGRHLKIEKSQYLRHSLADFDKIWQCDVVLPSQAFRQLKFEKFKTQDGGGHHLENLKITISRQWFDRFRPNLAR